MTIEEYISRLSAALSNIDSEEAANVLQYYTEILEDAEDPQAEMAKFGSPEQLAAQIMQENGWQPAPDMSAMFPNMQPKPRRGMTMGRAIALVLTSPFWLTVYVLIACLFITVVSVYIAFPATAIGGLVACALTAGEYSPLTVALLTLAAACTGLTMLLYRPLKYALKGCVQLTLTFSRFIFGMEQKKFTIALKKPVNRVVIVTGAVMTVIGVAVCGVCAAKHINKIDYAKALGMTDRTYELSGDITELTADLDGAAVLSVKPSYGDTAKLECKYIIEKDMKITDGSAAEIKYDAKSNRITRYGINFGTISYPAAEITLYLPQKAYDKLTLDSTFGDISLKDISVTELNIAADAGGVKLDNVLAKNASMDIDYGDVDMNGCKFDSFTIDSASGDLDMNGCEVGKTVSVNMDYGDMELDNVTAGSLSAEMSAGDLEFKGVITGAADADSVINCDYGDVDMQLGGRNYTIAAFTDLGEVTINGASPAYNDLKGSVVLRIENSSGDVNVDTD